MAPGPAPKAPEERRRRNQPAGGEWIDLPELAQSVLPKLPARGKGHGVWAARTRAAWEAWRSDPVTSQYGPADVQLAIDLAWLYESWVREPTAALAGEIRQRQDALGLTPKGRQDRRWRLAPRADVVPIDRARDQRSASDRMKDLRERAAAAGRAS
jgi:hypothetical protein